MDTPKTPYRVEICRFPQNKRFAMTFSWDDGVIEDRRVVAFMNEHGLKGTFNLNSKTFKHAGVPSTEGRLDLSEIASLYAGHEVAIHTSTHPHLPLLDPAQAALEVLEDKRMLEDLVGYPVRGMAYPYGTYNQRVIDILRSCGIVYSRTAEQAEPCFPPRDPLAWPATAHMFTEKEELDVGQRFLKLLENPRAGGVYFVWGHSYEFARPTDRWAELEKRFKPLAGHADVWYCTNIQLFDYEAARRRMVVAANKKSAYNPNGIPVTLKVDDRLIDVPPGATVSLVD